MTVTEGSVPVTFTVATTLVGAPAPEAVTLKLLVTEVAARKLALPACDAVTTHEPTPTIVSVAPDTVQIVLDDEVVKLTVRPELAVALRVNGGDPKGSSESVAKVIICDALAKVTFATGDDTSR